MPVTQTTEPASCLTPVSQIYQLPGDKLSTKGQQSAHKPKNNKAAKCPLGKRNTSQPQKALSSSNYSIPQPQGPAGHEIWTQGFMK